MIDQNRRAGANEDAIRSFVVHGGTTLNYSVEGEGPTLLVVGSSIFYPRTFSENLRRERTVLCADLPHFGNLDPAFNYDDIGFDFYSDCIEAVRVAAGVGQVAIAGHSHHGNVALEYAKRYPTNISHVILIGSPPANVASTVRAAEEYWTVHASQERKAILKDRRDLLRTMHQKRESPLKGYVAQYVADAPLYWENPRYDASWLWEGMTFDMKALAAFRRLYEDYELSWGDSMTAPVLVVMGGCDFAVPPTLWEGVLPRLKGVTFHEMQKSGHTPQLEQPEEFDQLLLAWLEKTASTHPK